MGSRERKIKRKNECLFLGDEANRKRVENKCAFKLVATVIYNFRGDQLTLDDLSLFRNFISLFNGWVQETKGCYSKTTKTELQ